jgi:hypothetical protein
MRTGRITRQVTSSECIGLFYTLHKGAVVYPVDRSDGHEETSAVQMCTVSLFSSSNADQVFRVPANAVEWDT